MSIRQRWFDRGKAVRVKRDGEVVPIASNSPVAREAYRGAHAHTEYVALFYRVVVDCAKALPAGAGKLVTLSLRQIQQQTRKYSRTEQAMPIGTVRDQLASLRVKHSIVAWDLAHGKDAPRGQWDGRGTTCYRLPTYIDVLAARAADPKIGRTGKKFWVIGKERRFLTPMEIASWNIDPAAAEKLGVKAATIGTTPQELAGEPVDALAGPTTARASVSPPGPAPPVRIHEVSKVVWEAARANTVNPAFRKDRVLAYERKCHDLAREAGETLSTEEIVTIMVNTRIQYRVKRVEIFEAFFKVVEEGVAAFLDHRAELRKDEAAANERRGHLDENWERERKFLEEVDRRIDAMGADAWTIRVQNRIGEARHAAGFNAKLLTAPQLQEWAATIARSALRREIEAEEGARQRAAG